jgi:hypothetical protein
LIGYPLYTINFLHACTLIQCPRTVVNAHMPN